MQGVEVRRTMVFVVDRDPVELGDPGHGAQGPSASRPGFARTGASGRRPPHERVPFGADVPSSKFQGRNRRAEAEVSALTVGAWITESMNNPG